jgi:hypothetical protein
MLAILISAFSDKNFSANMSITIHNQRKDKIKDGHLLQY